LQLHTVSSVLSFPSPDSAPPEFYSPSLHDALPISFALVLSLRVECAGQIVVRFQQTREAEDLLFDLTELAGGLRGSGDRGHAGDFEAGDQVLGPCPALADGRIRDPQNRIRGPRREQSPQ